MSRNLRLSGEVELQALQSRMRDRRVPDSMAASCATIESVVAIEQARRPYERDVVSACLEALALHPSVGWFHRMNVGALEVDDRTIRFAFKGCSDILGQLTFAHGGRSLAIECKRPGEEPTDDQAEFLWKVWNNGGCAFVATDAGDIFRNIPR